MERKCDKVIDKLNQLYDKEEELNKEMNRILILLQQTKDEINMVETLLIFYQRSSLRKECFERVKDNI